MVFQSWEVFFPELSVCILLDHALAVHKMCVAGDGVGRTLRLHSLATCSTQYLSVFSIHSVLRQRHLCLCGHLTAIGRC